MRAIRSLRSLFGSVEPEQEESLVGVPAPTPGLHTTPSRAASAPPGRAAPSRAGAFAPTAPPCDARFRLGYHQTAWDNGTSILQSGFQNKDRTQGPTAMLGPGVYFATTPEHTVGKAQHGQPDAMMLECYVFTGKMEEVGRGGFKHASGSDAVYFRGFNGRPEFVVKDSRRICIITAYKCDPATGSPLVVIDEGARRARLQWAQTAWRDSQLRGKMTVDLKSRRMENAMERIEYRGRAKKRDRKRINKIFREFAGPGGTINRAQLYSLLCTIGMPPANNKEALQEVFDEFDKNGNGRIGKKEFRRAIIRRAKRSDFDFDIDSDESDD